MCLRVKWTPLPFVFLCISKLTKGSAKNGLTGPPVEKPCPSYAGFRLACCSPLCRYAAWSSLAVSELQLSAAMPLWLYHWAASLPSWIEFNCLRSATVGKAARLSIYWQDAACRLVIPLRQAALAQLYKNHHFQALCNHLTVLTISSE